MKIVAIGDIHAGETYTGLLKSILEPIQNVIDVLILPGDLTAHGWETEAQNLVKELSFLKIPIVTVLGNHEFDNGGYRKIKNILKENNIIVLDGDSWEYQDVGFAGMKGFGGGFDNHMLTAFGEEAIKIFALESTDQALKLENALAKLQTNKKVVVLHYSPISQTVEGEPLEIYPFLGSTHLEEPINNFNVDVVFHGHAHRGKIEGKTSKGIPVFNTCLSLLQKHTPEKPYIIYNLD